MRFGFVGASREIEKHSLGGLTAKQEADTLYNPFAICDAFGGEKIKAQGLDDLSASVKTRHSAEEVFLKFSGR